jgi:hypothetical protein
MRSGHIRRCTATFMGCERWGEALVLRWERRSGEAGQLESGEEVVTRFFLGRLRNEKLMGLEDALQL